ncbi:MAG: hypothetical protein IPJ74_13460 [Saprospiraceae bacterium]|nr:hypothetical protein [Saprospiraceae bacterium]
MKQIFSLIIAGMIGGLVTLGGVYLLPKTTPAISDTFAQQVNLPAYSNVKPSINNIPFDFTEAASKAMPSVVHIAASASQKLLSEIPQKTRISILSASSLAMISCAKGPSKARAQVSFILPMVILLQIIMW